MPERCKNRAFRLGDGAFCAAAATTCAPFKLAHRLAIEDGKLFMHCQQSGEPKGREPLFADADVVKIISNEPDRRNHRTA